VHGRATAAQLALDHRDSDAGGGADVSTRQAIGAVVVGLLTGVGFAALFVYVLTGECIP
jgi:hypothetical protein